MFLLVDKPLGWSSFDVVAHLKHRLPPLAWWPKKRKIWHGWTLDPWATGVLIIATDTDTKKLATLLAGRKRYRASFERGRMTDTRDTYPRNFDQYYPPTQNGQWWLVNTKPQYPPSRYQREWWLTSLHGHVTLPLPPFRASKHHGQPVYKQARKQWFDPTMIPESKESFIYHISPLTYEGWIWALDLEVSGGTYIRSLAWLAYTTFGIPCVMTSLVRTWVSTMRGRRTLHTPGEIYTTDKLTYRIIEVPSDAHILTTPLLSHSS